MSTKRTIDYTSEYNRLLQENIKAVRETINDNDMQIKIKNYATKYDLPYKYVKRKILTDSIFANQFAKDPSKQSYNQKCARAFIEENDHIDKVIQLPADGPNALFVVEGKLVQDRNLARKTGVKSIDFFWKVKTNKGREVSFYASHKYTKDEGGAQDNQYEDLKKFMENAKVSTEADTYFLAIGDGDYYQRIKENGKSRITYMNNLYKTSYCLALTSNDIDTLIETIITD